MDATFLIIVLVLVSFGLIMMFSASYANAFYLKGNSLFYISRQLPAAAFGIFVMLVASRVDYRIFKPLAFPLYLVSLVLLVIVLFMKPLNNARRWIFIGPINFQPSEIAKFAVVIFFAALICKNYQKMTTFQYGIGVFLLALAPIVLLMIKEPHLSGTVLIISLGAVMMFIGGTDVRWFIAGGIVAVAGIAAVIIEPDLLTVLAHYAGERIEIWLDPFSDPIDAGFQTVQSLYAIGSGGLMGAGIGASRQKYLYLPEPYNDFIFAIVCEELGFIGAALVLLLFALLILRGYWLAVHARDRFGALLIVGIITLFAFQVFFNIGVVTGLLPVTGISLPFFSYGGTALIIQLVEMGIVLGVSRQIPAPKAG